MAAAWRNKHRQTNWFCSANDYYERPSKPDRNSATQPSQHHRQPRDTESTLPPMYNTRVGTYPWCDSSNKYRSWMIGQQTLVVFTTTAINLLCVSFSRTTCHIQSSAWAGHPYCSAVPRLTQPSIPRGAVKQESAFRLNNDNNWRWWT